MSVLGWNVTPTAAAAPTNPSASTTAPVVPTAPAYGVIALNVNNVALNAWRAPARLLERRIASQGSNPGPLDRNPWSCTHQRDQSEKGREHIPAVQTNRRREESTRTLGEVVVCAQVADGSRREQVQVSTREGENLRSRQRLAPYGHLAHL
eukprot:522240-Prorocentrum_minimum.AAC.1